MKTTLEILTAIVLFSCIGEKKIVVDLDIAQNSIINLTNDTANGELHFNRAMMFVDNYRNTGKMEMLDSSEMAFHKSMSYGSINAYSWYGHMLLYGDLFTQDTLVAIEYIKYAASNGSSIANYDLGLYELCHGNFELGESLLIKADSLGNKLALYNLYLCIVRGEVVMPFANCKTNIIDRDESKANYYLAAAANKGNLDAQIQFAYYCDENDTNEIRLKSTIMEILNNADLNNDPGQFDEFELFLIGKYGTNWNDTIQGWE